MANIQLTGTAVSVSSSEVEPFTLNVDTLNTSDSYLSGYRAYIHLNIGLGGVGNQVSTGIARLGRILKSMGSAFVMTEEEIIGQINRYRQYGDRVNLSHTDFGDNQVIETFYRERRTWGYDLTDLKDMVAQGEVNRYRGVAGDIDPMNVLAEGSVSRERGIFTNTIAIYPEAVGEMKRILGLGGEAVSLAEIEGELNRFRSISGTQIVVGSLGEAVIVMEKDFSTWLTVKAVYHTDYRVKGLIKQ